MEKLWENRRKNSSYYSRYLSCPGKTHWQAVKWILRYLKGTSTACLEFGRTSDDLAGYVDSDHTGDLDKRISLAGYVFTVGSCAVSWKAKLQPTVALSTIEEEFMVVTKAVKEAIWLRGILNE